MPANLILKEKLPAFLSAIVFLISQYILSVSIVTYRPETLQVHAVLENFRQRGQLFIETFPPLSFLFASSSPFLLGTLLYLCHAILVFASFPRFRPLLIQPWYFVSLCCIASFASYWYFGQSLPFTKITALESSRALGELLALIMLVTCWQPWPKTMHGRCLKVLEMVGGIDALMLASISLGMHIPDAAFCQLFLWVHEAWTAVTDVRTEMAVFKLIWLLFRKAIITATTLTCIFMLIFPLNELASGGNYNLRYLPPMLRRDLRPSIIEKVPQTAREDGVRLPLYNLRPSSPVSLYIPRAGFLWTDDYAWDISSGMFQPEERILHGTGNDLEALEEPASRQNRVIFSDRLNLIGPWFFQHASQIANDEEADDLIIRPGEIIYLRNYDTGSFLTPDKEQQAITDLYDRVDPEAEFNHRKRTSAHPNPSKSARWKILYDSRNDRGLRLWNSDAQCFLATSYRTYPNMRGRPSNDTILHSLRMEIEACCTTYPSKAASTFYVVDGLFEEQPRLQQPFLSTSIGSLDIYQGRLRGYLLYTYSILSAMYSLGSFRRHYSDWQDTPVAIQLLHEGVRYSVTRRQAFMTLMCCSVLLTLSQVLYARRRKARNSTKDIASRLICTIYITMCIAESLITGRLMWDSHFLVGLALVTLFSSAENVASA